MADGIKERGTSPYRPRGAPASFADVHLELLGLASSLATQGYFRGVFPTEEHADDMRPAPAAGDYWFVASTSKMYRQLRVQGGRLRADWSVTVEVK